MLTDPQAAPSVCFCFRETVLLRAHQTGDVHQVCLTWEAPRLLGCALPTPARFGSLGLCPAAQKTPPPTLGAKHSPAFLQLESHVAAPS